MQMSIYYWHSRNAGRGHCRNTVSNGGSQDCASGVQLFSFGLLAELQMRTYHESQGRPIYRVRSTLRGREAGPGLEV